MRLRVLGLTAVLIIVACPLVGCGAPADPLQRVLDAAHATASEPAFAHLTLSGATAFGPPHGLAVGHAWFGFRSRLGYERVDLRPLVGHSARSAYLVFTADRVYLQPILSPGAALPGRTTWVSTQFTGSAPADAGFPRFVTQVEALNAELLLDEILLGTASASLVGEPVIDHVPLSEYSLSIDLNLILSKAHGPSLLATRAAVNRQLAAPGTHGFARISVWIDGPGRIVMLQTSFPGSGLGTVSISLSGFGTTIGTSLPPSSEIAPISAIAQLAGGPGWPWVVGRG